MLKARQRTQARFESFLQVAVADNRCELALEEGEGGGKETLQDC